MPATLNIVGLALACARGVKLARGKMQEIALDGCLQSEDWCEHPAANFSEKLAAN